MADETTDTTGGAASLVDIAPAEGGTTGDAGNRGIQKDTGEGISPPPAAIEKVVAGPWIKDDGSFVSDWTSHLPEDIRDEAIQIKLGDRVRSVTDLARKAVNSERLIGKKGVILPTEKSTPEEVAEYRKAMGVPESVDGYQVKPEKLPEGFEWNDADTKPFLEIAHKYNVPPAAMKELVAAHVARQAQVGEQMTYAQVQLLQKKYDDGIKELSHAWGDKFETNRTQVQRALAAVGCPSNDPGLISPNVVKAILNLSNMISDTRFVSAGSGSSEFAAHDPGQLAISIVSDKTNAEYEKYHSRDPQTTAKVEALFKEATRLKKLHS
jgi:hypothetical protein